MTCCAVFCAAWEPCPRCGEQQREALRADLHLLRHAGTRDEIAQMLMATVLRSSAACEGFHTVAGAAREQPMERIMQCVNEHYRDPISMYPGPRNTWA